MRKNLTIIGIGTGKEGELTADAKEAIRQAAVIIGASRMLASLRGMSFSGILQNKKCLEIWKPREILEALKTIEEHEIAVVMSGDTGFNSGCAHLLREIQDAGMEKEVAATVHPGVGAIAALSARTQVSWDEAAMVSLHGKRQNLYRALVLYPKVFVLSGRKTGEVLRFLMDSPFKDSEVFIGELMGSPGECIEHISSVAKAKVRDYDAMTTMLILPKADRPLRLVGKADGEFIRGNVPMTKSAIRAIVIGKMAIRQKDVVYDIGCGTGSVSVEAAFQAACGTVYAFDCSDEAVALTEQNRDRFFCKNIEVSKGMAPEAFRDCIPPDVAFVGGSKGRLGPIIRALKEKNEGVRIVITAITLETVSEALSVLENEGFIDVGAELISAASVKKVGNKHMLSGENPVYIIAGTGDGR